MLRNQPFIQTAEKVCLARTTQARLQITSQLQCFWKTWNYPTTGTVIFYLQRLVLNIETYESLKTWFYEAMTFAQHGEIATSYVDIGVYGGALYNPMRPDFNTPQGWTSRGVHYKILPRFISDNFEYSLGQSWDDNDVESITLDSMIITPTPLGSEEGMARCWPTELGGVRESWRGVQSWWRGW